MPTYEYACTSCGQRVEAVQSFTDEPLTTCAACGGPMRKVFGAVGIVLKGSGFYKTDSRSSNGAGKSSREKEGTSSSSDGEGSKTPAAKESTSTSTDTKSSSTDGGASGTPGAAKVAAP